MGEEDDNNNNNNNNENNNDEDHWSCCNDAQSVFLLLYIAFCALALITWKTLLAKPMRLMGTFLHEMSHAVACWITGGSVYNIEVYNNEGGVTRFAGGCRCLIIPAGYVGASLWAMVFVILSGGRKTATFAASVLTISLLLALCYSPNRTLIYISCAYALITSIFIFLEWYVYTPLLQFLILFYGVCVGIFAIADIKDDTIVRTSERSDAYACYKEVWPCCAPRCVGLQWALLAIFFQWMGIWIALAQMSDECEDKSWIKCLTSADGLDGFVDVWDDFGQDWNFGGFWEQPANIEWQWGNKD